MFLPLKWAIWGLLSVWLQSGSPWSLWIGGTIWALLLAISFLGPWRYSSINQPNLYMFYEGDLGLTPWSGFKQNAWFALNVCGCDNIVPAASSSIPRCLMIARGITINQTLHVACMSALSISTDSVAACLFCMDLRWQHLQLERRQWFHKLLKGSAVPCQCQPQTFCSTF